MNRGGNFFLLTLVLFLFPACQLGYVLQQGLGQFHVVWGSRDVQEVLADPAVSELQKKKIVFALEVVEFGETQLGLTRSGNYSTYYDNHNEPISYTVFACPKTSLVPVVWVFPIVGAIPYLGFFDRDGALEKAKELNEDGLDSHVGEVWAYSTLGWFQDPILASMLNCLARYRTPQLTVELDGQRHQGISFALVANTRHYGGSAFSLSPQRELDDGKMEVYLFRGRGRWALSKYLVRGLLHRLLSGKDPEIHRVSRVRIESETPVSYQIDGEFGGKTPVDIEVIPKGMRILVP